MLAADERGTMRAGRGSGGLSIFLMIAGVLCLVVGSFCLYVKQNILDSGELSARVVASVERAEVRKFIAHKTAAEIVGRVPALESSQGAVETATNKVVASDQFKTVLGTAVAVAETRLVDKGNNDAAMKLQNVGDLVRTQLATVDPKLAAQVPADLDAKIASLSGAPAVGSVVRTLKTIRFLGVLLPPVAIILLIASVLVSPDRRAACGRLGVTLVVFAVGLIVVSYLGRNRVLDVVPSGLDRNAAGGVWDEVLGTYRTWLILGGVAGLALVAVAVFAGRRGRDPAYA
jgi:hypothetical protein